MLRRLAGDADVAGQHAGPHRRARRLLDRAEPQAAARHGDARQAVGKIVCGDGRLQHDARLVLPAQRQVGAREQVRHAALGQHTPGLQQHEVVGQPRHLVQRMGHIDDGQRHRAVQAFEVGQDLGLARRVQRGQRLVHQQQPRAGRQGAGDGHALALAAGERGGTAVHQRADAEQVHRLVQRDAALGGGDAALAVVEVAAHVEVREQRRLLDHVADRALVGRHEDGAGRVVLPGLAVQRDPSGRPLQSGQRAQQRRLAAARRAEQRAHALRRQGQRHLQREVAPRQRQPRLDHRRASAARAERWIA